MINILLSRCNFQEEWAKNIIEKYIDSNDKVAVVPFAFSESMIGNVEEWESSYNKNYGKYYREIVDPFLDLGIKEENIQFLNFFKDTIEKMKQKIQSSDIVFFTGGLPDMAVKNILEKDLLEIISKSRKIIGVSAGALIQLDDYYISPDEDCLEFTYSKGLGLIKDNFYIEVHYSESDIQNSCIEKVLKEKTNIVYAIKDTGGIVLEDNNLKLFGNVNIFIK